MTENCDDYEYYKKKKEAPKFIQKGYRKLWPEDEHMNKNLKCLDDGHSKSKCINEDSLNKLEKDLKEYSKKKGEAICPAMKNDVLGCLQNNQYIYNCDEVINAFKGCVDEAARYLNKPK